MLRWVFEVIGLMDWIRCPGTVNDRSAIMYVLQLCRLSGSSTNVTGHKPNIWYETVTVSSGSISKLTSSTRWLSIWSPFTSPRQSQNLFLTWMSVEIRSDMRIFSVFSMWWSGEWFGLESSMFSVLTNLGMAWTHFKRSVKLACCRYLLKCFSAHALDFSTPLTSTLELNVLLLAVVLVLKEVSSAPISSSMWQCQCTYVFHEL